MKQTKVAFAIFLILWNKIQNQKTPAVHLMIAEWLEKAWIEQDHRLLLMAFRSCGKSTIVGLFAAWALLLKADLRILVLAADQILARKMVRNVKRIIERHPLCVSLKPDNPDQWASDRFTVQREKELRDPSMLARGIGTNITGSRADLIICDDVEVPNTCASLEKRLELRQKLIEANFVLVNGGVQLYVGTPHHYHSIYAQEPRVEFNEATVFLDGYRRLEVPIYDPVSNRPAWPEKYTIQDIHRLKKTTGPNKFESQMMLRPINIIDSRLDPHLLHFYDGELHYTEAKQQPVLSLNEDKLVSCSAWWDPAFGQVEENNAKKRDHSVFALIFRNEEGLLFLHELHYIKCHKKDQTDEATQQCQQIAKLCQQYHVPSICVEINGIGRFLPNILRNCLKEEGYGCAVIEKSSSQAKAQRILEAFDAPLAARVLHVHERIKQTPFLHEMQEWQPGSSKGHDDGLDAVAGAILEKPAYIRMRSGGLSRQNWQGASRPSKAKDGFNPFQS